MQKEKKGWMNDDVLIKSWAKSNGKRKEIEGKEREKAWREREGKKNEEKMMVIQVVTF